MAMRYFSFGMKRPLIVFLLLLAHYAVSASSHTARLTTYGAAAKEPPPNNTHVTATQQEVEVLSVPDVPRSAKLTTFGSNNPPPKKNETSRANTVKGKLCNDNHDCAGLRNTTCAKDRRDGRMKCLCSDKERSIPVNLQCPIPLKAPQADCNKDEECVKGAVCIAGNSTISSSKKTCQCKPEYHEEDDECSGGMQSAIPNFGVIFACHLIGSLLIVTCY